MYRFCILFSCSYLIGCTTLEQAQADRLVRYQKELIAPSISSISHIQLDEGVYKIHYSSASPYAAQKSEDAGFLLAAELCYENEYSHAMIQEYLENNQLASRKGFDSTETRKAVTTDKDGNRVEIEYEETIPAQSVIYQSTKASSFIKCINDTSNLPEHTIVMDVEVVIKSVVRNYEKEDHLKVRYPELSEKMAEEL